MSKLIEKTREIAKSKNIQCESHNIKDIFVDENGIFCKNCGKELVLVPAWIIGQQKNTFKEGD
jgi:rRNA maturation endonuclease Nob1